MEKNYSGHGDYHDLWINPDNSKNMIISDDGGGEITFDNGNTWSSIYNMPTAQFYRVNVDNLFPYNLYGGQQDNSTLKLQALDLEEVFLKEIGQHLLEEKVHFLLSTLIIQVL